MMVFSISIILISMFLVIMRGLTGPTYFDRILAANSFGTIVVVLIALMGNNLKTAFYIDIAITYALINFIATIALLRYFKFNLINTSDKK